MISCVIFDFDGTLVDTGPGIKSCVVKALRETGCPIPSESVLDQFPGPPLTESFSKFCGINGAENDTVVERFRSLYAEEGLWQSVLYPGVQEGLRRLVSAGRTLCVATSKPGVFVDMLLHSFGIAHLFTRIEAVSISGQPRGKSDMIRSAMEFTQFDRKTVCMVGDRKFDLRPAKQLGIWSAAVSYGYGTMEELTAESPDVVVSSFDEVASWVLRQE